MTKNQNRVKIKLPKFRIIQKYLEFRVKILGQIHSKSPKVLGTGDTMHDCSVLHYVHKVLTVCPRSSDPFYAVSYCIKWVTDRRYKVHLNYNEITFCPFAIHISCFIFAQKKDAGAYDDVQYMFNIKYKISDF